jgi:hypothetical protein
MTGQPGEAQHGHARPSAADMRASLAAARAMLTGDDPAAHDAAQGGHCAACTTLAALSLAFNITSTLAGEEAFNSGKLAHALYAAVEQAERELDTGLN